MYIIGNFISGIAAVLSSICFLYTIVVVASVVISWVGANPANQIVRIINQLTWPVYSKIQQKFPTTFGGIDFTALIVLLLLMFIDKAIISSLFTLGERLAT